MTENSYKEIVNRFFDSPQSISKDRLMHLMDESMAVFQEIRKKMQSGEPALVKEALAETAEIRQLFEFKKKLIAERTGLHPDQLEAMAQNINHFSPKDREAIEAVQAKYGKMEDIAPKASLSKGPRPSRRKKIMA